MSFTFELRIPSGEGVGRFVTAVPNWNLGDVFLTGRGDCWRILEERAEEDEESDLCGYWTVEPV